MTRYAARFRYHGPTIHVGTFDSKAEADAAVAGAKRLIEKLDEFVDGTDVQDATMQVGKKLDPRTLVKTGTVDPILDDLAEHVEERKRFLEALPKQHSRYPTGGQLDREKIYGKVPTKEEAERMATETRTQQRARRLR